MVTPVSLQVRIASFAREAEHILFYDLRAVDDADLPRFTAGAHVDLHLPNGLIRSYSLLNSQKERHRYVIGVNLDPNSRGGSRFVHEHLRAGDVLTISAPRNNFPLIESAPHTVFIAGGIGITPLWSMIQRLASLGRSWELHYCARTRKHAVLTGQILHLSKEQGSQVHFNFDQEPGGKVLDLNEVIDRRPENTHFYCCGPLPMLEAFEKATASRPAQCVHVEYFAAREPRAADGGFIVELAHSGKSLAVAPGKTILQTLLDDGVEIGFSCMEGVCGSCEVRVLDGIPDHRDLVLSKAEQASNTSMMVCCSGCKGDKLVLDL